MVVHGIHIDQAIANLQTSKDVYHDCFSVSMGVVFLYSSFLVYIQQSTAVMLCTAAHVHPCREWEKGEREKKEREEREWEGSRRENLAFTVRDQRYIMGGQTILLHAVFLTNHYTTKQCVHVLYKPKAACQALITIAPDTCLNKRVKCTLHLNSGMFHMKHTYFSYTYVCGKFILELA